MRYFIDIKYNSYTQKRIFQEPFKAFEIISIAITSESRFKTSNLSVKELTEKKYYEGFAYPKNEKVSYYVISNEFDLKKAWNNLTLRNSIIKDLLINKKFGKHNEITTFHQFKKAIKFYGKSDAEIRLDIFKFIRNVEFSYTTDKECHKPIIYYYDNPFFNILLSPIILHKKDLDFVFDLKQTLYEKIEYNSELKYLDKITKETKSKNNALTETERLQEIYRVINNK